MKKIAIVYDRVNKWGGAERVLLALNEIFPDAPLYTSVYSIKSATWGNKFAEIKPSFLNKLKFLQNKHEYLAFLMPLAFESHNFDGYDVVVNVTSESAKSIITSPNTTHICYCLTPTRYLWSGYQDYFATSINKTISEPLIKYLRHHDKIAAHRPDIIIAISTEVQGRIKKYYGRESEIIHPPVVIGRHQENSLLRGHSAASREFSIGDSHYYLAVGRFVKYKKFDLVIRAFNKLNRNLVIIGTGSEEKKLKNIANKNIKFIKNIPDEELAWYYANCKALIFAQTEDFGLVAAEAQLYGKPVIAYKAGGALDIVKEDETGVFFESQTVDSLINAIEKFEEMQFDPDIISKHAKKFSKENFQKKFEKLVYG